jgi:hypothetical protein
VGSIPITRSNNPHEVQNSSRPIVAAMVAGLVERGFSWIALASKPIGSQQADVVLGGKDGSKNLQDYWRRDASLRLRTDAEMLEAGELVREANGRLWHLCHVPLAWRAVQR